LLILAFETSAKAGSVALMENGVLLGENYQNTGLTHSQTLLSMVQAMLEHSGKTPQDVGAVAVAAGPGSFTGVRIGVAAAKGFSWGSQIPCYGVSTLEAMARNLGVWEGVVCCVMDARRNQVYNALFRMDKGMLTRLTEDRAISLDDLKKELKIFEECIFLVGDGSNLCYNTLKEDLASLILPAEHRIHQRAGGVALAAQAKIDAGEDGNAESLEPNYLRLSQAERERLAREQEK
jgi:tRNA threonylcarbamoyladenosine biosynthesis protein TsaB